MRAEELSAWRRQAAAGAVDLRDVARLAEEAKDGSAEAAYVTAVFTAAGVGVAQDLKAALTHLQRAAEGGHRQAQTELAALVGNWRLARDIAAGKANRPETWAQLREAVDVAGWLRVPDGRIFSAEPRIATVRARTSLEVTPSMCA